MIDRDKKSYQPSPQDISVARKIVSKFAERDDFDREQVRGVLLTLRDENFRDTSSEEIETTQKVLLHLLKRPSIYTEDAENLDIVLREEAAFAKKNWKDTNARNAKDLVLQKEKARRASGFIVNVFVATLGIGSMVGLGGMAANKYYQENITEEGIARKQSEAERQAQIKYREAVLKEQQMTLGLEWSKTSGYNWQVRYLPPNPNVEYSPVRTGNLMKPGNYIDLGNIPDDRSGYKADLLIHAEIYQRMDGVKVPSLSVHNGKEDFPVILRTESTPEINTNVIQALDVYLRRQTYFKVEFDSLVPDTMVVTQLRQVKK